MQSPGSFFGAKVLDFALRFQRAKRKGVVVADETFRKALRLHRSEWFNRALSCQELDADAVQKVVARLYSSAGLPLPERLVWLDSPLAGAVAAAIFARTCENLYMKVFNEPVEAMQQKLWHDAANMGQTELWHDIDLQIKTAPLNVITNLANPIRTQIARQLAVRFSHMSDPYESQQVFQEDVWSYILARVEQQASEEDFAVLSRIVFDTQFASACANQSWYCGLGGMDGDNLELLSFAEQMGMDLPDIAGVLELSSQVHWWWAFDKVCIVTYRPRMILIDQQERLHNDHGPAVEYNDGWCIYARKGSFVPERVIRFAHRKSLADIEREQNIEIRRHLIEVYGVEQYLKDAEAVKIDQDSCGVLYRKDFLLDEPLKMVKVLNSTPEPDGSQRYYYLRVPPNVETAREAVAWTFFMTADEYDPDVET